MSFPLSPTNGQTAVLNGITYSYSSASTLWTRVVGAVPNTIKSTSSATPPSSPSIGDEWYNTTTDALYRYTSDGVTSYWLDYTGVSATINPGAASALVVSQPTYAVAFNGTGQYLTTPLSSSLQFGSNNFTIECWINPTSKVATYPSIFSNYNSFTAGSLALFAGHSSGSTSSYQVAVNGATFPSIQGGTIVYNTWTHLSVVRNAGVITLYVNGVSSGTYSFAGALNGVGSSFVIGTAGDNIANGYINGHISNFRVINGTALYTANFATPSAPLTAVTNTVLLTCQNVPITDASTNNFAVTNVGGASLAVYSAPQVSYANQTLYYRLNTDLAGANVATAQNVLGVGVTLLSNTVYQFEGLLAMNKTTGTTSASISLLFGGTASLNNIMYSAMWEFDATSFQTYVNPNSFAIVQVPTAAATTQTSTTAVTFYRCMIKGTVSINNGGTFIPQYSLSAAPGGAFTTAAGSYITLTPIGRAGANSSLGTWA